MHVNNAILELRTSVDEVKKENSLLKDKCSALEHKVEQYKPSQCHILNTLTLVSVFSAKTTFELLDSSLQPMKTADKLRLMCLRTY